MKKKYIIAIGLVLAFLFYWFQWRPSEIRVGCYDSAKEYILPVHGRMSNAEGLISNKERQILQEAFEDSYITCLKGHGINK